MTGGSDDAVVIVGGGVAGGAAACLLARAGQRVLLLERENAATDKICGEFVSVEAQRHLARLGIDAAALGGHPITHLRLVRGDAVASAALPFRGLGLSRRVLDDALLARAAACGADVCRGHDVRLATRGTDPAAARRVGAGAVALEVPGVGTLRPRTLLLATGKHDLRGLRRVPAHAPEDLVGFKMYFALAPAQARELAGHVEVLLFEYGYAGLQLVEGGRANLCLLVDRDRLREGGWDALLSTLQRDCGHLQRRLSDAVPLLQRPLTIYRVPYGYLHPPGADPDGVYRLGDQMGVIPSFSGDGMSIALHSAAMAVRATLAGAGAADYHRQMRADIGSQIARAGALYRFGRRPAGQRLIINLARAWPRGLQLAAALTRVPAHALERGFA
jgi:flavin-dependent dehydrogenase